MSKIIEKGIFMNAKELKERLRKGALNSYSDLYPDVKAQTDRMIAAINSFEERYGENRDINLLSVPGRSEIIGNHTDHNRGKVIAGAINRDIIAVASKNDDGVIRFHSEGYPEDTVKISEVSSSYNFKRFTSGALIGGVANGFLKEGYAIGGFEAYSTTEVLKGSGLSSSAAFEVMIGNIFNHLYNGGTVDNKQIAKLAQYSENEYFGKPCGLMDQMACAVGGFVYMDFLNENDPTVESIEFSLSKADYSLCIVNTGGSHANLNDDYASITSEMKGVAVALGKDVLREVTQEDIISNISMLRERLGDRAILRALHFVNENERVEEARSLLKSNAVDDFLKIILRSGKSSFEYLQNVYTNKNPDKQGLSLSLALTDSYLSNKGGAFRVHGGGFAGTTQAFVKNELLSGYVSLMNSVFGEGAVMMLNIRPLGAIRLF